MEPVLQPVERVILKQAKEFLVHNFGEHASGCGARREAVAPCSCPHAFIAQMDKMMVRPEDEAK